MRAPSLLAGVLAVALSAGAATAAPLDAATVYGNAEGCAAMKSGDLGAADFLVLTTETLQTQQYSCDFVQVLPAKSGDLFVNAICYGEGQATPQTYAITEDSGSIIIATTDQEFVAPGNGNVKACAGVTAEDAKKVLGSRQ